MIDSIGSAAGFRPPPPPMNANSAKSLSEDQESLIAETLSNYDAANLSAEDATSIVNAFAEAGIQPNSQFADALAESGFDAKEIGNMANAQGGPPAGQRPPPPNVNAVSGQLDLDAVVSFLDSITDASAADNSSTSVAAELAKKFGLSEGMSLINVTA